MPAGDKCPYGLCKGRLITRTNKSTGDKFLGCSNYPKCDYIEPLKERESDATYRATTLGKS